MVKDIPDVTRQILEPRMWNINDIGERVRPIVICAEPWFGWENKDIRCPNGRSKYPIGLRLEQWPEQT